MNQIDPLDCLPPETAGAVRAELRAGEHVAFAAVPLPMPYSMFAPSIAVLKRVELAAGVAGLACGLVAVVLLATTSSDSDFLLPLLMSLGPAAGAVNECLRIRRVRREAARSACIVTNQRAMLLATEPTRAVSAVEAQDIREVYRWPESAARGEIRFRSGAASNDEPSRWFVPNPIACETAMAALKDSSGSAGDLQTAG